MHELLIFSKLMNKVLENTDIIKCSSSFKRVDSCAAEFDSTTNYLYSTYEEFNESEVSNNKIVVLGSGPNRIGQGIEFDYCCVQAALAFREENIETIMINSNPRLFQPILMFQINYILSQLWQRMFLKL